MYNTKGRIRKEIKTISMTSDFICKKKVEKVHKKVEVSRKIKIIKTREVNKFSFEKNRDINEIEGLLFERSVKLMNLKPV